tara:strand:- start:123 stop:704 length:582 start_codon:yes stop_codon:yes gene_type:complete
MILCGAFAFAQSSYTKKAVEVLKSSELNITGKTNVNTFTCRFNTDYLKPCQLISYCDKNGIITFKNANLVLNAKGFDCGSKGINRDFQKLLKTDEYPEITLELIKATIHGDKLVAQVDITMAGKNKEYNVPVVVSEGDYQTFNGVLSLKLSDYELSLPTKLFGLIVIKDDIEINFNIAAQFQNTERFTHSQSN